MSWSHPQLGLVHEMLPDLQEVKGWKHLYDPRERWEALTGVGVEDLLSQARANGCPRWSRSQEGQGSRLSPTCRTCLRRHHDRYWRHAYGAELMATTELIGRSRRGGHPTVLATPRGVWIVLDAPSGDRVFNAYRPHPPRSVVNWNDEDFVAQSQRRFEQETGMRIQDLASRLRREITRPVDAWHLALTVGATRAAEPVDAEVLARAEERLAALDETLRRAALPPADELLAAVEEALTVEDDDSDEVATAVLAVEDALVATEVLLGTKEAEALAAEVEALVAWAPEGWLSLQPLVAARRVETVGVARAWWETLEEVLDGLLLSDVEPVHAPSAPLARRLTASPWWQRWDEIVGRLAARVSWQLDPTALGWQMGVAQLDDPTAPWDVVAEAPAAPGVQVFVVDEEHPAGEPLTEDVAGGGPFWMLESPGQEAWFVRVEGIAPAKNLAEALDAAAATPGARVTVVPVSRPR